MELCSRPPQPAHFDPRAQAWIVSRYADVLAALHHPALEQERPAEGHAREVVAAVLTSASLAQWQKQIEPLARECIASIAADRPVDLVHDVLRPWTQEIAILILPYGPRQRNQLRRILRQRNWPGWLGKLGRARFKLFFRGRPGEKSAFIGISETLPGFLANAWLALLRNPREMVRLRDDPSSIPGAIEELLRYAGLVHSLARRTTADLELAGVRIGAGERVLLKLGWSNLDPQQFLDAGRLDVTRRAAGHLALGRGDHACVGAMALRLASAAITRPFVERLFAARLKGEIEWSRGDTLAFPLALRISAISQ